MPSFATGTVTTVRSSRPGLQRVEVDGAPAYVLTELIGPVAVGDRVVVNTTAVELGLGTGGWHVVHWNLSRQEWRGGGGGGGVLKLRYTSLQADVGSAEEDEPFVEPELNALPVVACDLHSQVACVAVAYAAAGSSPAGRLVYVMTDGGALPLAVSDLVADLRSRDLLAATVTYGQAFGGDHEAVNVSSALQVARAVAGADAVVVGPGPGVVGTRSRLGFTGLETAAVIDAADRRGARPLVCVRYSDVDHREGHRGVSHHTRTALAEARAVADVALPRGAAIEVDVRPHRPVEVDVPDVAVLLAEQGLAVTTMGRGPTEDPQFFQYAGAAGVAAARATQ